MAPSFPLLVDDCDISTIPVDELLGLDGGADGVAGGKDLLELFEGTTVGLDAKQVPDSGLDQVPSDEDLKVQLR
jgi:hypothetical protein